MSESLFCLKGKKAIITGGSKGIGKAAAEAFNKFGAETALLARSDDVFKISEILSRTGIKSYGIQVDISIRNERNAAFQEAIQKLGTVDILINNAGMGQEYSAVDFPLDQWDKTLEVNLTAAFEFCQLAGRIMIEKGSGKIINICSLHSYLGKRRIEAYAASKGGLALLTKSLAHEWGHFGINVNGIVPGFIETDISMSLRNDPVEYPKTLDRLPMGRWGKPEDLIGSFIFLASDASNYVNGHLLVVDGGILAV